MFQLAGSAAYDRAFKSHTRYVVALLVTAFYNNFSYLDSLFVVVSKQKVLVVLVIPNRVSTSVVSIY